MPFKGKVHQKEGNDMFRAGLVIGNRSCALLMLPTAIKP